MKLYVWNQPFSVSYGGSILYVLAENLTQARKKALAALDVGFGTSYPDGRTRELKDLGKPDRVIDQPYAEVYWWSE